LFEALASCEAGGQPWSVNMGLSSGERKSHMRYRSEDSSGDESPGLQQRGLTRAAAA